MYFPSSGVPTPGEMGLSNVEEASFRTSDGLTLQGWFVRSSSGPARYTVLMFNGNAGNRAYRAGVAAALRKYGLAVFLFDYRGFGGNPGSPSEGALAMDGRAAREYLLGRPDVVASRIIYFGESLGTAVAVELASAHEPAALILRSPFVSMTELARLHYPFLPARLLLRDRFPSVDHIRRVRCPLLIIAGSNDRIVPIEQSRRLHDVAVAPKTFLMIPEADHNDAELFTGETMITGILRFVEDLGPDNLVK
ncbi:MAG TPA: alpha/beta hydrolase [Vicinamibacterales bacterium]|jgi:fermentation-respiration switch protein FrsA (DUF1100 family)